MSIEKREQIVSFLKISEQCQRFEDMVKYVRKLIELTKELTLQQIQLFTTAFKNASASRRTAWRAITNFQAKEQSKNSNFVETIQYYKSKIQKQLLEICEEIIQTIDGKLLPKAINSQSRITLLKTRGDYYRYICEFAKADKLPKAMNSAINSYTQGLQLAEKQNIPKTSALRLGVALNLGVLYYEIANDTKKAIEICQKSFNQSSNCLNDIDMEEFKDTTTVMQLMYDNLITWRSQQQK